MGIKKRGRSLEIFSLNLPHIHAAGSVIRERFIVHRDHAEMHRRADGEIAEDSDAIAMIKQRR